MTIQYTFFDSRGRHVEHKRLNLMNASAVGVFISENRIVTLSVVDNPRHPEIPGSMHLMTIHEVWSNGIKLH